VCHSDIHVIDGDFGAVSLPIIPGHEIIGTVRAMYDNVTGLAIGQRVGIGWQAGSCLHCEWCIQGFEQLCADASDTCVNRPGGYANAIQVDARFVHPIPDPIESIYAAPLLCAGVTVYSPLRTIQPSSRVGVIGIGGLGHLALQFANKMGCDVTALSTSPDKEAEARTFGAGNFIATLNESQMRAARGTLDVLISTVNVDLKWSDYMRLLRPNGRLIFVGASPGKLDVRIGPLTSYQYVISGSSIGGRSVMREMLAFAARHDIRPQIEVMPMTQVNEALERVRSNKARYRVVLEV
jgi:uncharacterized zinc-type alcohol dehydrogenase-like protein